ncbi:hypothetical protein [Rhizobium sp. Root708]|uniref:hypothetical protein n=1 Tax=Rhizobium sp. Root708 TaxID=1736592 RepID=UPI0012E3F471|nr:hypothetical protein [Rhizobium sp. Root708]
MKKRGGNFAVGEEGLPLLSSSGDILSMVGNRLSGSEPVDKAFSGFSDAFFPEKLDENKNCGNHRSTWKAVNWVKGGSHNHGRTFDDNKALSSGAGNRG